MTDVTQILNALEHGDPKAAEELLPLVYDDLRCLAAQKLSHESPRQTLQNIIKFDRAVTMTIS